MNYEKDINIDDTALDIEWLEQPKRMLKYTKILAERRRDLDYAKENLDLIKADMDKEIRTNPSKFGIEKITEAVVQSAIFQTEKYQEANKEMIEAKYEVDIASGAVRAFEQRKDALENLVRLFGQNYFAGPKFPRNIQEEREAKQKRTDEKVGNALKNAFPTFSRNR